MPRTALPQPDDREAFYARQLGKLMVALGVVLFAFLVVALAGDPVVSVDVWVAFVAAVVAFNASDPLRRRMLPHSVNGVASIVANVGLVTVLVSATGGPDSDLWVLYLLGPAIGAVYFGRAGTLAGLATALTAHTATSLPGWTALSYHQQLDSLLRFFLVGLGGLPMALFVEHQADIRRRLSESLAQLEKKTSELAQARVAALHAERMAAIGHMAALIAHEVGQPLGVLDLHASQALDACPKGSEAEKALLVIRREIARLDQFVSVIRRAGRRTGYEERDVDVNRCMAHVLELVSPSTRRCCPGIDVSLDPALPGVRGSSNALEQVFLNLLFNACQAIEQHDGEDRRLAIKTAAAGNGGVLVSVCDSGPGILADPVESVFEAFRTLGKDDSSLGIGLSMCKQVVEGHGGTIRVGDTGPHGTTFEVWLPCKSE